MNKVFEDLKKEGVWKIMMDGFPSRLDQAQQNGSISQNIQCVCFLKKSRDSSFINNDVDLSRPQGQRALFYTNLNWDPGFFEAQHAVYKETIPFLLSNELKHRCKWKYEKYHSVDPYISRDCAT